MNNILIIDSDKSILEILKACLENEGYKVYCAESGLKALELYNTEEFKLVILDPILPDIEGEEICKKLRYLSDVFIFILTTKDSIDDIIWGLSIGADEYCVKPFNSRELTVRVNALFRRIKVRQSSTLVYDNGKLEIDKNSRYVKVNGREVYLTQNEFEILCILAESNGKALTRKQLTEKIFDLDFHGSDRVVDVHIKNIRKKIEQNSKEPRYILTVNRLGYRFGINA